MTEDHAATVAARAARAQDPVEGLRAVAELRETVDQLEALQVDRALEREWSWAQVGRALGISKQAAHRRHARRAPVKPLESAAPADPTTEARVVITAEARNVVIRAKEEAAELGEPEVQPVHLLLALLQAPAGPAQDALLGLGIDAAAARDQLAHEHPGRRRRFARIPTIAAETRRVFEESLSESQRLCHGHLGPEHLLLSLLRDADGPAVKLLTGLGAAPVDVEAAVYDVLRHTDFARSL